MNSIAGKIVNSATTVSTTIVPIPTTAATGRRTVLIYNNGSETVYLGDSDVTTTTGYPLAAGDEKAFDLKNEVILYGRTASGSSNIRTMEGV